MIKCSFISTTNHGRKRSDVILDFHILPWAGQQRLMKSCISQKSSEHIDVQYYVDFCMSVLFLMDEIHPTRPEMLIKWWRIKGYVHHFKGFAEDMPPKTVFAKQIHAHWQFPLRFWGRVVVHEEYCPDMCFTMPAHVHTLF